MPIKKKPSKKVVTQESITSDAPVVLSKSTQKRLAIQNLQGAGYWVNRPRDDKDSDWAGTGDDWIREYWDSQSHPHRQLILDALKGLEPFAGLLEVGCNAGPNLARIQEAYPETQLAGVDVNVDSLEFARQVLPKPILRFATAEVLPFADQEFDVLLYDASLMYVDRIEKALSEATRVARKAVIIVDRIEGNEHIRGRDYGKLLEERGFKVEARKLTNEDWPTSMGWQNHGYIWIGHKQ